MSSLIIASGTVLTLGVTWLYFYIKNKQSYWQRQGIKSPRLTLPILGHALDYFLKPMQEVLMENFATYGKTFGIYEGTVPVLVTSDSDLIRQITVKDSHIFVNRRTFKEAFDDVGKQFLINMEDQQWRRVRDLLTPTFTSGKMKNMFNIMKHCSSDAMDSILDGQKVELKRHLGKYTLDIIARCCFASKFEFYDNSKPNAFVDNANQVFHMNFVNMVLLFTMPKKLFSFIDPEVFPRKPMRYFKAVIQDMIEQRREKNVRQNDFLQILIDSHFENGNSNDKTTYDSEDELISQAVLFLAAGYETTSTLLTFTFYLLSLNKEEQDKLYDELINAGELDYDKVMTLPYLDAVVHETLRLFPPGVIIDRIASQDYKLPGSDVILPKGTDVQMAVWTVHHDADNYDEPERFNPDRFLPENKDKIKPYTYLPFGSGQRNCVGMRFASLEAKLLIADMVKRFRFSPTDKTPLKPVFKAGTAILAYEDIEVVIHKR
ncbi:Cytochrome P450 3A11 [Halotydeus destructor]|nr:Cytochrome P450 3A11 [Halotydeus destructor]